MTGLVDIYSHTLFGIDKRLEHSDTPLSIFRMEYYMGMRHQFCTPVINSPDDFAVIPKAHAAFEELKEQCRAEFLDLSLYLGSVVRPTFDIAAALKGGTALNMAGTRYVLIGLKQDHKEDLTKQFDDLLSAGYIPVIAHPEHIDHFRRNPHVLEAYVKSGVLLQINIPSVMGQYGKNIKTFTDRLLKLRWASFAATDNKRVHFDSRLFTGYEYIQLHYRKSKADLLLIDNGMKLIRNEIIDNSEAEPWRPIKRTLFQKMFGNV